MCLIFIIVISLCTVCVCVCVRACVCAHVCAYLCVCVCEYMCVSVHACAFVSACMYLFSLVCVHVHACVCVCLLFPKLGHQSVCVCVCCRVCHCLQKKSVCPLCLGPLPLSSDLCSPNLVISSPALCQTLCSHGARQSATCRLRRRLQSHNQQQHPPQRRGFPAPHPSAGKPIKSELEEFLFLGGCVTFHRGHIKTSQSRGPHSSGISKTVY